MSDGCSIPGMQRAGVGMDLPRKIIDTFGVAPTGWAYDWRATGRTLTPDGRREVTYEVTRHRLHMLAGQFCMETLPVGSVSVADERHISRGTSSSPTDGHSP